MCKSCNGLLFSIIPAASVSVPQSVVAWEKMGADARLLRRLGALALVDGGKSDKEHGPNPIHVQIVLNCHAHAIPR